MNSHKKICVFTSSRQTTPADAENMYNFGAQFPAHGFDLIFGGADKPGLMRQLALGVHDYKGTSTSIIPTCFGWDTSKELGSVITVPNMGERKHIMLTSSDAFVVLKGGLGTLDELMEVWSIKCMGGHKKPIFVHTTPEYKTALIQLFQAMVNEGTADQSQWDALEWCHSLDDVLEKLKTHFA